MAKQPLSQGLVEALNDSLVPVYVHTPAPDRNSVLSQQPGNLTHKLAPRVNLEKPRPFERAPLVDAGESISNFFSYFRGQRLGLLIAGSDIHHGQGVLVNTSSRQSLGEHIGYERSSSQSHDYKGGFAIALPGDGR